MPTGLVAKAEETPPAEPVMPAVTKSSPFTKPVRVAEKAGSAAPYSRVASAPVSVKAALFTVSVPEAKLTV